MTAPGASVPGAVARSTSLRDALVGVGILLLLLNLVEIAVPSATSGLLGSVVDGVVVACFAVTGLLAWYRRPHNATGRLMVVTSVAVWGAGTADDDIVVLHVFGTLVSPLPLALLLHLLLAFPSGRLAGRAARWTVAAGYVVALAPQVLKLAAPDAASATWTVQAAVGLLTLLAALVLAARRLAGQPPVVRRQLLPFVGYGCVAVAVIAVAVVVIHLAPDTGAEDAATLVQLVALCGLPLAFLAGLTTGAFGRAGEVEEVARGLSAASTEPARLDDLVVRALGDPRAYVAWAVAGEPGALVDSTGAPVVRRDGDAHHRIDVHGVRAGALIHDARLVADDRLVGAVAAPVGLAMDHHRLVVELRAALQRVRESAEEVRRSRRRLVTAADTERRRIAQDLHDGAQQRVVLVGMEVQRLGRLAGDPERLRSSVAHVGSLCEALLDDLRDLVHGIMPSRLTESGLAVAVRHLAGEVPLRVTVTTEGTERRFDAEVESAAYFVVAEALTNAVKHADARAVAVDLAVTGDRLTVAVSDDGRGWSGAAHGFGLRSARDRVEAVDGRLTVGPGPTGGTRVEAEVPVAHDRAAAEYA